MTGRDGAAAQDLGPLPEDSTSVERVAPRRRRSDDTKRRSGGGANTFLRELPVLVLVAFVLAFLLRTFVVQVFFIPSSSMEPTLQIDDRMAVEKITFRFREPRRGDVVVFEEGDTSFSDPTGSDRLLQGIGRFLGLVPASARDFVKRVVAVEGDEVRIEEGRVFVNDVPLEEPYVAFTDEDNYGPATVPAGHLFFLGDNRPNSSDSRRSLGFVPVDAVVGRAVVIIWPFQHWRSLTEVEHDLGEGALPSSDDVIVLSLGTDRVEGEPGPVSGEQTRVLDGRDRRPRLTMQLAGAMFA